MSVESSMKRTTIMFPARLRSQVEKLARQEGVSLGELVCDTMRDRISKQERVSKSNGHGRDPFFIHDDSVDDGLPADVSANIDKYLGALMDLEERQWSHL
jgi:hypothetical protein